MRTSRRRWSVGAATITAALFVAGCQPANEETSNHINAKETPVTRLPAIVEPPLDRAALLQLVAKAASAAALGQDDVAAQRGLDGDRFEVRIRFGCTGDATQRSNTSAPFNVGHDAESRTLKLRVSPDLSKDDVSVAAIAGDGVEAVEGFWMRKPWLLSAGCSIRPEGPSTAPTAEDVAEEQPAEVDTRGPARRSSERVGIAQFFTSTDSRTARRDSRAYETTKILNENEALPPKGFDLVLSGRLRELTSKRVIACQVVSPDLPPECVVSVLFDKVRIDRSDTRELLAEWSG